MMIVKSLLTAFVVVLIIILQVKPQVNNSK